jgi:hypothetical protein
MEGECGIWVAFTACTMLSSGQKTSHFMFWRLHLFCSGLSLVSKEPLKVKQYLVIIHSKYNMFLKYIVKIC